MGKKELKLLFLELSSLACSYSDYPEILADKIIEECPDIAKMAYPNNGVRTTFSDYNRKKELDWMKRFCNRLITNIGQCEF